MEFSYRKSVQGKIKLFGRSLGAIGEERHGLKVDIFDRSIDG